LLFSIIPKELEKSLIQIDGQIDVFSIACFEIIPARYHGKLALTGIFQFHFAIKSRWFSRFWLAQASGFFIHGQ
jgi:hypothetical protein